MKKTKVILKKIKYACSNCKRQFQRKGDRCPFCKSKDIYSLSSRNYEKWF